MEIFRNVISKIEHVYRTLYRPFHVQVTSSVFWQLVFRIRRTRPQQRYYPLKDYLLFHSNYWRLLLLLPTGNLQFRWVVTPSRGVSIFWGALVLLEFEKQLVHPLKRWLVLPESNQFHDPEIKTAIIYRDLFNNNKSLFNPIQLLWVYMGSVCISIITIWVSVYAGVLYVFIWMYECECMSLYFMKCIWVL